MNATERFIDKLMKAGKVVKQTGDKTWMAQCPAHDDGNPSLSILGLREQVIAKCFAGCQIEDVAGAVGLTMPDLFDTEKGVTYEYRNRGRVTRRVHRSPSKQFRQEVLEKGDGALYVFPGVDLEQSVKTGAAIYLPEGEKDVEALTLVGKVVAVTSAGGAQAWAKADWSALSGAAEVVIVADSDEPGMERARGLVKHLRTLTNGIVRAVQAKTGKDAADHLLAGHTVLDFVPVDVDTDPEFEAAVQAELDFRKIRRTALERERLEAASKVSEKLAPKTLGQILDLQFSEQWVIPDLFEEGDRMVLTGLEGGGKSYMLRQIGICAASGLHPFKSELIDPQRVLVVDTENSERQWSRAAKYVTGIVERMGQRSPRSDYIIAAGARIDLSVPADVNQVHKLIDEYKPSMMQIGPLYKLVGKEITTDDDAAPLIQTLDSFRERGIVLLMEAHTGNDGKHSKTLRPRGSSALLGWPEFGLGLLPDDDNPEFSDLVRWRGDREKRDWPEAFRRGWDGELPWMPLKNSDVNR